MLKQYTLANVESLPHKYQMEDGVIYYSDQSQRSSHLCPCSCGDEVVLSHHRGGWRHFIHQNGKISISTKIYNNCNTNYIIKEGFAFKE